MTSPKPSGSNPFITTYIRITTDRIINQYISDLLLGPAIVELRSYFTLLTRRVSPRRAKGTTISQGPLSSAPTAIQGRKAHHQNPTNQPSTVSSPKDYGNLITPPPSVMPPTTASPSNVLISWYNTSAAEQGSSNDGSFFRVFDFFAFDIELTNTQRHISS